MTMLRFRFSRSGMMALTISVVLVSGTHSRLQDVISSRSAHTSGVAVAGQSVDFSFEQVDRQTILALVDEHRRDTDVAWRRQLSNAIYEEAMEAGIDPLLVAAIVARESSFRDRAVSHAGAVGLMQLRPFVARELARKNDLEWEGRETLQRPELNVKLGACYYRELIQRFEGDSLLALAAYHRGPTRLRRQLDRGTFDGSRYALRVLELYRTLAAGRSEVLLGEG
jgi:soluble lytic murein transglycosylase-like protein